MTCEQVRRIMLEITLDGGTVPQEGPLGQHLRDCLACRAFLARMSEVDAALRVLPLEMTPAGVRRQILEQIAVPERPREPFLPWTLWLPVVSLVSGIFWAYLALLWYSRVDVAGSVHPTVANWLAQLELWVTTNQSTLSVVALSVTAGLLFTLAAIAVGLYVGRSPTAPSH